jgi:glycosyltransferase involved in cell wall biosynthesis
MSRADLQSAFNLQLESDRRAFVGWFMSAAAREYGLDPNEYLARADAVTAPPSLSAPVPGREPAMALRREATLAHRSLIGLEPLARHVARRLPTSMRSRAKVLWLRMLGRTATPIVPAIEPTTELPARAAPSSPTNRVGANLIGYARAEVGMGEHVRMSAAALTGTDVQFGVFNFAKGVPSRQNAVLSHGSLIDGLHYAANIFHINADQMLLAFSELGERAFADHYNVGYWAWELAKCPAPWVPVCRLIDEIWAPSTFIQSAFQAVSDVPVVYMPICVEIPPIQQVPRQEFGLATDRFLFLFVFDFLSFMERKNPLGTVRAFKHAFSRDRKDVGLVIKAMNGRVDDTRWQALVDLVGDDERIVIINETMDRERVIALIECCDCFVSLHRSEGFGRGPAEAMALGKPVVVTNYSGNTDFTKPTNSYTVNYSLIPVGPGEYVFSEGQVWAEPDVEHAAWQMRKVFDDRSESQQVGRSAAKFIKENFGQQAVGRRYEARLRQLGFV